MKHPVSTSDAETNLEGDSAISDKPPPANVVEVVNDNNVGIHKLNKATDIVVRKGKWNLVEELAFVAGRELHGNEWLEVAKIVKTRSKE